MKKPTKKQIRSQNKKRQQKQHKLSRRQAELRAKDQLWHEMRPLLEKYNIRNASGDEWDRFAANVMFDSRALYDETEFQGMVFDPAEALYEINRQFNARVPPPDELDKLPEEERQDLVGEAYVRAAAAFVSPDLQSEIVDLLGECRARLKRKRQPDMLALAAATEMLLHDNAAPILWGTCGIVQAMLQNAFQEAMQYEDAKETALQAAQAIQPDVTDVYDLEEGSPADEAFWNAVDKSPGLEEYLERQEEVEADALDEEHEIDHELATELFDPEELHDFVTTLVENLKANNFDITQPLPENGEAERQASQTLIEQLPKSIQSTFPQERFEELLDDLDEFIQGQDEFDALTERAQDLHDALSDSSTPYWENPMLIQFVFNALVVEVMQQAGMDEDEYDGDEYDDGYDDDDDDDE